MSAVKAKRNRRAGKRALKIEKMLASTKPVNESLKKLNAEPLHLDSDPDFVSDYTKSRFIEDVLRVTEETGVNKNQLAGRMGKSRQYVGKMLNARTNFTVATMAEVACALGCQLAVRLKHSRFREMRPYHTPRAVFV